jgi:hypothetical protein
VITRPAIVPEREGTGGGNGSGRATSTGGVRVVTKGASIGEGAGRLRSVLPTEVWGWVPVLNGNLSIYRALRFPERGLRTASWPYRQDPDAKEPPARVRRRLELRFCPHFRACVSDYAYVLRLVTLLAGGDVELDSLALVERLVALTADVRVVDENVVARLARDEAVALVRIEELDRA